jgi:hypothetical protein
MRCDRPRGGRLMKRDDGSGARAVNVVAAALEVARA